MRAIIVRQGEKYSEDYTKVLTRQIKEHGGEPIVLGDGEDADIPLSYGYKGWWAKMEIFSDELKHLRPFLYIDLDSFVLGPLPEIPDKFYMCREWSPHLTGCQSSVMIVPKETDIWDKFIHDHEYEKYKGDQIWLSQYCENIIQEDFPGLAGSYKWENQEQPIHKIVTFHGRPKPHNATGWTKKVWDHYIS